MMKEVDIRQCWRSIVVGSNLTIFKLETTTSNTVAKRTQHVAPNNVVICYVDMLRSFGRGLNISSVKMLALSCVQ